MIPYAPRRVFRAFHDRRERWAIMVAHRRCGKTVACINDLIRRAVQLPREHGRFAYLAPFRAQAKEVAWAYLKRFAQPIIKDKNEGELWIELVNGARISVHGADNPDRLRGAYLDGCVLDEYADMRPSVWGEVLRPMLVAETPAPGLEASAPPSPDEVPNNHLAYAVQWFLFAGIAALIYGIALRRRMRAG